MMRFIGDIHGKLGEYTDIILCDHDTVQVGDFGFGFIDMDERLSGILTDSDRFIRGNHDDPALISKHPNWIEDGHYDHRKEIMYVGGAWSIDQASRVPGLDWWPDEQLSVPEFSRIHAMYVYTKPKIMVTHDCPAYAARKLFDFQNSFGKYTPNLTSSAFDAMFMEHQPDIWIFGHWHERRDMEVHGTRFICLEELGYIDLDL